MWMVFCSFYVFVATGTLGKTCDVHVLFSVYLV